MADLLWSTTAAGSYAFDPAQDTFTFDEGIAAAGVEVATDESDFVTFTVGPKTITLQTSLNTLTTANIAFGDGSELEIGDNDTATGGDDGPNGIVGGAGDDYLIGLGGDDTIDGGSGDDVLDGGLGNDSLLGGDGNDHLDAGAGDDTVLGSEGRDTVLGGDGNDLFTGAEVDVNVRRDDTRQSFEGGAGDDTIDGAAGDGRVTVADYRNAATGIVVNLGAGIAGDDGDGGIDTLINVDRVIGSMHDDAITGGSNSRGVEGQNEQFEGLAGHDTIDGGPSGDNVLYVQSPGAVIVNLSGGDIVVGGVTVAAGTARDGFLDAENLDDGEAGYVDRLISISNVVGSDFNDTLVGGGGDDQFEGRGGDDSIDGGAGFDQVRYFQATGGVAVNLGADEVDLSLYGLAGQLVAGGTAEGIGGDNGVGVDTFENIEGARGSDFDDVLVGGGPGVEAFEGLAGNDTLDAGEGDFASLDYASYGRSPSAVIVNLGAADIVFGSETISGGQALDGFGVNGNENGIDTLFGINGARGSFHDDTLVGGAGDETFEGRQGNDSIVGGLGVDTLDYTRSGSGGVVVNMFGMGSITVNGVTVLAGTARDGLGGIDTFSGIENVIGSNFDDYMQGNGGVANRLDGGAGNDTLIGGGNTEGAVSDTLLGGDGDDILRQGRGNDVIDGGNQLTNDRLEFAGNSGITYGTSAASVHVNLGAGTSNADRTNVDTVNGAGGDTATISGIEWVNGTAGHDILVGGSLARAINDSFLETFRGNAGNDTMDGSGGSANAGFGFNDRVDYATSIAGVTVNFATGVASDGFGGTDKLININWVHGSNFGDVLRGGNTAFDRFERFEGRRGSDTIDGGSGIDDASYIQSPNGVNVNLETGLAFDGWGFTDALFNIERVRGSDNADILTGSNRLDVIEIFIGEEGNDTINGGAGIDFAAWRTTEIEEGGINVTLGTGTVTVDDGFGGTDTLINIEGLDGTNSDDTLSGGTGEQWFRGRGGSDIINGGAGIDTADYSTDNLAVTVNLGTGTATDGFGGVYDLQGTDTLLNIENVLGSRLNDRITGSAGVNLLDGHFGNDTVDGGAGNDTLLGGAGNDSLQGNGGNDTLDGEAGNDVIRGGADADVFIDKTGNDTLDGGSGNDTFLVDYTTGTQTAIGGAGGDTYVLNPDATGSTFRVTDFDLSGADRDLIDVGALLDASARDGFYTGQDPFAAGFLRFRKVGANKVLEWDRNGGGNQYVEVLTLVGRGNAAIDATSFKGYVQGSGANNKIGGSTGDDLMLGLGGNDSLNGGSGADQLFGGDGRDTMRGGAGDDTYEVDNAKDQVIETSNTPGGLVLPDGESGEGAAGVGGITDTVIAAINYSIDRLKFVENVRLAASASRATGNGLANELVGNAGNDTLVGGGGNDTLDGGAGNDLMNGGAGNDVFFVNTGKDVVKEGSGGGTDTVHSLVTEKLDANVEHLVLLGSTAVNGIGNTLNNSLKGNGNKNVLTGDAGNDTLDGGAGNDTLNGGAGNDLYIVDAAGDVIVADTGGVDTVRSTVTESLAGGVEHLILLGNLAINGTGNTLANRITGNGNDNVLDGGSGNDTLAGNTGNDTLKGGAGTDSLLGGAGDDVYVDAGADFVVEGPNGGYDIVQSSVTETLASNVEELVLTGGGTINGTGNGLDNLITGNGAANTLNGGAGDDFLDGAGGNDLLIGGSGADALLGGGGDDTLVWDAADSSIDGGEGLDDTLRVNGGGEVLDLDALPDGLIQNIEIVDLGAAGSDNTLVLTLQEVLDISSSTDFLQVEGGSGDEVSVSDGTWVDEGVEGDYHTYSLDGATLRINIAITAVDIVAIA